MIQKHFVRLPSDNQCFGEAILNMDIFLPSVKQTEKNYPPFLFCHGLAANRLYWYEVAKFMANEGYLCVSYDMRDHGENSSRPNAQSVNTRSISTLGIDKNCDDLKCLLEYLSTSWNDIVNFNSSLNPNPWRKGAVLVGHSYGGNIVLEAAIRFPTLVCGLVCIDGGFIELQKKFPDFTHCVLQLSPPSFFGVSGEELEQMVREKWCKDWPEQGIQAMLANFHIQMQAIESDSIIVESNAESERLTLSDQVSVQIATTSPSTLTCKPTQRRQLWVEPKLALPVHRQLLHDLWQHRPSDRYALVRPDLPILLVPTGAKAVSPFSACKLADVQEAIHLLQHRGDNKHTPTSSASNIGSVGRKSSNGSVEPIGDIEYLHTSPNLRVRWLCKPGHDAPIQYASLVAELLIDNYQDGFLSTSN